MSVENFIVRLPGDSYSAPTRQVVVRSRERAATLVRESLGAELNPAQKEQFREFLEGRRHTLEQMRWAWCKDADGRQWGWGHYVTAGLCEIER